MKYEKKTINRRTVWAMLVLGPVLIAAVAYVIMMTICPVFAESRSQAAYVIESIAGLIGIASYVIIAYLEMRKA